MHQLWRSLISVLLWGAIGTDTAIETADVALMDDDLRKIPAFVRLSHATRLYPGAEYWYGSGH